MIKVVLTHSKAKAPIRSNAQAAGLDLHADISVDIPPGKSALVPCGFKMAIPDGYVGLIWARSKLAAKMGLQSGAGVVDSDYRGEVHVLLFNHSDKTQEIRVGDRIAQMLIQKVDLWEPEIVDSLEDTLRGCEGITSSELRLR